MLHSFIEQRGGLRNNDYGGPYENLGFTFLLVFIGVLLSKATSNISTDLCLACSYEVLILIPISSIGIAVAPVPLGQKSASKAPNSILVTLGF